MDILHDNLFRTDTYHLALHFFIIVSLLLIGFFIAAMIHMRKLVAAPRAWRLILGGRVLNSAFLIWIAYRATEAKVGTLTWEYWLVVGAALITLAGLIDAMHSYRNIPYGRRWSDKHPIHRRRRDDQFAKESNVNG